MCDENQFKQWPKTEKQLQKKSRRTIGRVTELQQHEEQQQEQHTLKKQWIATTTIVVVVVIYFPLTVLVPL